VRGTREKILVPGGHSFRTLLWDRSLREVECVVAPHERLKVTGEGNHWHFHVEMELTLFATGEGTRFVGDHISAFGPGDLVLLGEKLPHYWHTRGLSSGISLQWHFPESHAFWAFPENLVFSDVFKRAARGLHITGSTAGMVSKLLLELPRSAGAGQLALFMTIMAHLSSAGTQNCRPLSVRCFNLPFESQYQQAISKAMRHLLAHFRDEVRLQDVLQVTGMSRPTFARQFKKHSGRTFSEFLNRLRLQAACRELRETDRSVLDIALTSGFTQLSFFNRLFRRELKCSPTEFRAKARATTSKRT
jgi:AraC-like DNA-binding protein